MPIYEFRGNYHHDYRDVLNQSEMEDNAKYFASVMLANGWSLNAIAGAFGNWESEATMSTNRPQYSQYPDGRVGSDGRLNYGGFGLPQWTQWTNKYKWWSDHFGYNLQFTRDNNATAAIFENQLEYHEWECTYGLQGTGASTWTPRRGYNMKWADWRVSKESPEQLATVYYWMYEFSAAEDPGSRPSQARKWYNFLQGNPPGPQPPTPSETLIIYGGKNKWRKLPRLHR